MPGISLMVTTLQTQSGPTYSRDSPPDRPGAYGAGAIWKTSLEVTGEECAERRDDVVRHVVLGRDDVEVRVAFADVGLEAAVAAAEGRERRVRRARVDDPRCAVAARGRTRADALGERRVAAGNGHEAVA